eukprot:gene25575-28898_t
MDWRKWVLGLTGSVEHWCSARPDKRSTLIEILNSTVTVSDALYFGQGLFKGADNADRSRLVCNGASYIEGSGRKTLRSIDFIQIRSTLDWTGGDWVFSNSKLHISAAAKFSVNPLNSLDMRIQSDYSRSKFDFYRSSTLNTQIDLANTVPPEQAIYDIVGERVAKISVSRGAGTEIFNLDIEQDLSATEFYAQRVPNLQYGYKHTLYNRTFDNVDEDQCGALCVDVYNDWCRSYDYFFFNQTCSLSVFRKSQVGGLTPRTFLFEEQTYPLSHYELRTEDRAMDSLIVIDGELEVTGGAIVSNAVLAVQFDIDLEVSGIVQVVSTSNFTLTRKVELLETSSFQLNDKSMLAFYGPSSSLQMTYGATLQATTTGLAGANAQLTFSDGLHYVNGAFSGSLSLYAADTAQ